MRRIPASLALLTLIAAGLNATASGSLANDDAADAIVISALPFGATFLAEHATTEAGEPQPEGCGAIHSTVWFTYEAGVTEDILVTTFGSSANTTVAVYADAPGGTLLACSDDPAPGFTIAEVTPRLDAGQQVFIQIGTTLGQTDAVTVGIESLATPPTTCAAPCPTFQSYQAPGFLAKSAGELNIGVNPKTNAAMVLSLASTLRVTWDEDGVDTWKDVTGFLLKDTNDPILWTDQVTGRTFIAQLRAYVGSVMGYTDDDGATWQITEPATVAPSWDHQSIAGGPYPLGFQNPIYPRAMYYCAQPGLGANQCARSDNGGLSWGAPLPMQVGACGGLHGHIAVSPTTGTVVVPHKSCSGGQGVVRSTTAGTTWTTTKVPGTTTATNDPAAAYDDAGKLYFLASSAGKPLVSVSANDGANWSAPIDLGAKFGIRNTAFPMAVAGDAGRAAVAFYGTPLGGSDQSGGFTGEWHVYIAITTDGGLNWNVVDATPDDAVQRGCIWMAGGSNACRNLLDFQGMTIDRDGRVLVAAADGCLDFVGCLAPSGQPKHSRASFVTVIRQTGGPLLRAT